ncbi:sensor histidine kinase [Gracilibacillus oryzae]|uniref:histidine kinase n=1 Tax=Gracilibacillus oryzae TaxID=1672701 RepID=A0A7C8GS92_9BACI|nr:sensor histidine kinase [Gracilibacillus oryzae]KAB8131747.1 sensor histidine kinase [Gracilibacillus oryzae]
MIHLLKTYYRNLRLKHKMVILTFLVLLTFSIGGVSILQYAFHLYNKEIYRQSAQALQVSTNSIEAELRKLERLSYQISTDTYVQSYLIELADTESSYNRYMIGAELRKRLIDIGALSKYVQSIQVYDNFDREYASGIALKNLSKQRLNQIKRLTEQEEGGAAWLSPTEEDDSIIVARDIREYLTFSFEKLGTVGIRVDIKEIVNEITSNLEDEDTSFLIFDQEETQIFTNETPIEKVKPSHFALNKQGYQIVKINKERYFLTYSEASDLGWTYMILTPYSNLFMVITQARTAVFVTYLALFLFVIFLGSKFTGTIVNPIESLNRKMKKVQTGHFDYEDLNTESYFTKDEAGQMHENFKKMMNQINYLIEENYKKQLLIKESEFKALQAQVNPHFLYNTLESINWSAKIAGEKKISQMAESLGYVLRASINMKSTLIPLSEEISIVDHYITIQKYRFEDRLYFTKHIPEHLLRMDVPKFILQPLVENSIRYGLQEMMGRCEIILEIKETVQNIEIIISDNGPGMTVSHLHNVRKGEYEPKGNGIGLKNISERIKILFGNDYGLRMESEQNKGTKVVIILPKEAKDQYVQSAAGR